MWESSDRAAWAADVSGRRKVNGTGVRHEGLLSAVSNSLSLWERRFRFRSDIESLLNLKRGEGARSAAEAL
ncbi:hypothetical protein B1810_10120 [Panacagrimonas perspica]|nr:hypothetical protein B1810_10120 [Panacagrimonas perspica]